MMTATRPATTQQFADIRKLLAETRELGHMCRELADTAALHMNDDRDQGRFDFNLASMWITHLVNVRAEFLPKAARRAAEAKSEWSVAPVRGLPEVPAGRYAVEVDGVMKFYVIEVSDSGYVTGYVQASETLYELKFNALKGVLARIVEVGILEAAKAYGREIGRCGMCNRPLTNPNSISEGIGPVCAEKLG